MKLYHRGVRFVTLATLFFLLTMAASAADPAKPTADIPFTFWVGATQLSPGQYSFEMLEPGIGFIRSLNGKPDSQAQVFLVADESSGPAATPSLTFLYRDGHFNLMNVVGPAGAYTVSEMSAVDRDSDDEIQVVALSPADIK